MALIEAALKGDLKNVEELLPKEDINGIDECGYTALHCASEAGHEDVARKLVEAGASLDVLTFHTEFTPLHFAVANGHGRLAALLVQKGADLNLCTQAGCYGSALHYAISKNDADVVKMLIRSGADVNLVSGQGYSPLLMAASLDLAQVCQLLLVTGASPNAQNEEGKAPLHLAAAQGFGQLVKILVDFKADLSLRDNEGLTAEALADKMKETDIAAYLKACASGQPPSTAPSGKPKEQRQFRTIDPIEGCGEGCAVPQ